MKKIILTTMGLSTLTFADFVKNGDIVIDMTTGLQWQDNADAASLRITWIEAINYCENLTLGGYDDWRLPNINELRSIIGRSRTPMVEGFIHVDSAIGCWSSTTRLEGYNANLAPQAWGVNFGEKMSFYDSKGSADYHVRCVRGGE